MLSFPSRFATAAIALCLMASTGVWAAESAPSFVLKAVALDRDGLASRATLTFEADLSPQEVDHFYLNSPPRYVVDLRESRADFQLTTAIPEADPLVAGVRFGQHDTHLRVVFDLRRPLHRSDIALSGTADALLLSFADSAVSEPAMAQEAGATTEAAQQTPEPGAAPGTPASEEQQQAQAADENAAPATQRPRSFVFGAGTSSAAEPAIARAANAETAGDLNAAPAGGNDWRFSLDRGLLEAGYLDDAPAEGGVGSGANLHLQTIAAIEGPLSDRWRLRLAARADGQYQYGDLPDLQRTRTDYDESWLRYDDGTWRVTAGAQRIIWGMSDDFSPTDRLSTRDFTRLLMDDLAERRRANPALRVEWRGAQQRLDLVYLPEFREAELPGRESVWYPVDTTSGAVAGLPLGEAAREALIGADIVTDYDGDGGGGLRYTRTGARWDVSATVQRVHNPEPYFTLTRPPSPGVPAQVSAVYPRTTVVGGGLATALGAWTLRGEAAWLSDSAYTRETDFSLQTSEEVNWVLGAEVFPGDGDLRVTTQLSGRHLLDTTNALDFVDVLTLFGEAEMPFIAAGLSWRARVRYSWRLDEDGSYINPELVFTAWEPSELYLGIHLYDGTYGTAEEFYSGRDMAVIGWRAKL